MESPLRDAEQVQAKARQSCSDESAKGVSLLRDQPSIAGRLGFVGASLAGTAAPLGAGLLVWVAQRSWAAQFRRC